jgi:hypothetical protein
MLQECWRPMTAQLLITMRSDLAKRFVRDQFHVDVSALFKKLHTARLIGSPGVSMRVSVAEEEVPTLKAELESDYLVEPDYALTTFRPASRPTKARVRAAGKILRR